MPLAASIRAPRPGSVLASFLLAVFALSVSAPVSAQGIEPPKWGAHIDLEGKAGTERNLGEADIFVPLVQDDDTLFFANLRTRLDDHDGIEGNFGLGLRHMLESGWNLGGYGYFDVRNSGYDNTFTQVTLGLEALSLDWDLRANGYLPVGTRSRTVDGLTTAELSGAGVAVRGGEERALGGFDAEVGWRLPVFDAEAPQQLRVYGGGYYFDAAQVDAVAGPRGRLELTFDELPFLWEGSRLSLGGEVQHDDPRGTQGFASLRLRIPLQVFDDAPARRLSAQERRMADPIVRDVDIVSLAGAFGPVETATETADGKPLAVVAASAAYGTDLSDELAAAGANATVVLSGSFNTTATTTLQTGQTVMGAGSLRVRTPSGKVATLTTPGATIAGTTGGGLGSPLVLMADDSTLSGMTVEGSWSGASPAYSVLVLSTDNVTLAGNTITADNTAGANVWAVRLDSTDGTVVRGNRIEATGGLNTIAFHLASATNVTVADNVFSASDSVFTPHALFVGIVDVLDGSTGNRIDAGDCHVFGFPNTGTIHFTNAGSCP